MLNRFKDKKLFIIANILFILSLIFVSAFLFVENRNLNEQLSLTTEEKNQRLINEINKVFDLPEEKPVVEKVVKSEDFKTKYTEFENAKEGDYLLLYRKARLNILYREKENRVVKTANVVLPISIELIGSKEAVAQAETKLAKFEPKTVITKKITEGINQAFVFDVDNDQSAELTSIAELLDYEVGSKLPASITPGEQTEIIIAVTEQAEIFTPAVESEEQ